MQKELKIYIDNLSPKETRQIVEKHAKRIDLNEEENQIIIIIDKKYAYNDLISSPHIENAQKAVKQSFGEKYEPVIKFEWGEEPHEGREKNVPHHIHPSGS